MGKLTVRALRAVLVVVLAGTVFVQALMVWALATDPEDGSLPLTPLRVITIPIIAGLSYEMLRLGARYERTRAMRALMAPGLWLQKITTKPPERDQIEVAIVPAHVPIHGERNRVAGQRQTLPETMRHKGERLHHVTPAAEAAAQRVAHDLDAFLLERFDARFIKRERLGYTLYLNLGVGLSGIRRIELDSVRTDRGIAPAGRA